MHMRRLLAELARVAVAAHREYEVDRLLPYACQDGREDICAEVVDGAQRCVDGGPLPQVLDPLRKSLITRVVVALISESAHRIGYGKLRIPQAHRPRR